MNHITTRRLGGLNGSEVTLEAGSPISFADMDRLGYGGRPTLAWDSMLEDGAVVPVDGTAPVGTPPAAAPVADLGDLVVAELGGAPASVVAPAPSPLPDPQASAPVQREGESCEAFAGRLSAYMREQRGESASHAHVRTWGDMEASTRLALQASAAFDHARKGKPSAVELPPSARNGFAHVPDPSKPWLRA